MFGRNYTLIKRLDENGNNVEQWVLDGSPELSDMVDPALAEMAESCNTDKDKYVRKSKIAGVNIVSRPCGIILSMEELYGSESLSQVLLPIHSLMNSSSLKRDIRGAQNSFHLSNCTLLIS